MVYAHWLHYVTLLHYKPNMIIHI